MTGNIGKGLTVEVLEVNQGNQNMPPQYTPLWHKDYFELKAIEKRQLQEELSDLPLST